MVTVKMLASVATVVLASAGGCGGSGNDPEQDSGRLQFHTFGRIQFNTELSAHGAPTGGAACRWRIETEPNAGLASGQEPRVVKRGDYGDAKIKVAKPDTVKVYLVTKGCGRWEKTG